MMMSARSQKILQKIYHVLFQAFGPQYWWPAKSKFEVIVGAILTQNTNWKNVEKALNNLKKAKVLSPQALYKLPSDQLAALIKPAGYFNVKAKRLKNFINFLVEEFHGDLISMGKLSCEDLREKLLQINGIGPETADSILLYALDKPIFVVDAYTRRFLYRHNMIDAQATYQDVQNLFMQNLQGEPQLFNEYHALIVRLGKEYCKPHPQCAKCPLSDFHYSLKNRCSHCYRALLKNEKRFPRQRTSHADKSLLYLCQYCVSSSLHQTKV